MTQLIPVSRSGVDLTALRREAARELDRRTTESDALRQSDICDWAGERFWIPGPLGGEPSLIDLFPHQKIVLRIPFTRGSDGHFPYSTIITSTVKKSGKSTLAAIPVRWIAETQTRLGEVYTLGNDQEQAKGRSFKFAADSIKLTPGCQRRGGDYVLPGQWVLQGSKLVCLTTGTAIRALSVDATGEAGSNPDLTVWTELWGMEYPDAVKFFDEMSPVPTKPDSLRLIETYAGYDGESLLLYGLYETGMSGRQMTNREAATRAARERDGERYEDLLTAFSETGGDPDALVPIWVNEAAGMFMYWDEGEAARRMPWQQGEEGARYYAREAQTKQPAAFERHHNNFWVGAESAFVPMTAWDACQEDLPIFGPKGTPNECRDPVVLGVDAAVTGDCFGVVAVTRHPDPDRHDKDVAVRAVKKWDPADSGGVIDLAEPEVWLRWVCTLYNVVQIAYDPFQLESMMQSLRRDGVAWCEPFMQMRDRLIADSQLYDLIINRRLAHTGDPALREHIANANVKLQKDEDSRMRIVKKSANRKVDLAVSLSMGTNRCLYLLL